MAKMKPRSRQGIPDSIPDPQVDSYLYWREREKKHLEEQARSEAETMEEVHRIYSNMRRDMQSHIAEFYAKYAKSEQITLAEARQRVSKMDIEEYGELAARYVADKDFSDLANEQMRLYNATMKINRLEYLKATLGLDMVAGYTDIDDLYTRHLTEMAMEEQKRMSGILHMTNAVSPKVFRRNAEAIAKGSFKGATFSERIWTNQTKMKEILDEQLQRGLMQGKNPRALMQELRPFLKDQQDHAEEHLLTLLQTEMARVQTEAQKMSYEENGVEKYTFICNELDGRTCPVCKDLDGNMYPVKEMMAGENASPIHPRCRCSTAAYMDRETFEKWLEERREAKFDAENESVANPVKDADLKQSFNRSEIQEIIESARAAGATMSGIRDSLSDKEIRALQKYIGFDSYVLNEKLRNWDKQGYELTEEEREWAKSIDLALFKLPDYTDIVYRSISTDRMKDETAFNQKYQPGAVVIEDSFISSSKEYEYDDSFKYQMIIQSKHGKDISELNPDEREVLFKRGSMFFVTKREGTTIYLEEM